MTISDRIKSIRIDKGLNQEDFAASIGIKRANYANIELGKQLPTIDQLNSIVRIYQKTFDWLINGIGAPDSTSKGANDAHLNAHLSAHPIIKEPVGSYIKKGVHGKSKGNLMGNPSGNPLNKEPTNYGLGGGIEHVVDTSGMKIIPVVDIKAAAGDGYLNAELIDDSQVLRLPSTMVKSGYHLCIRVKGPSMAPTFQDGGFLIIRMLERTEWLNLRDLYCYVVIDTDGKTFVKRIKNRFSGEKGGFITCMSDNPDKMSHPNFNLHPEEIHLIWYVEWYFTAKMPNIHDQYYNRVGSLEDKVDVLMEEFQNFKKQLKPPR